MTLTIVDRFCKNGEVNLQYLDNSEAHENPLPLLIVPGATENADDYLPFLQTRVVEWLPLPCAEDIRARRQRADTALRITPATLRHLLNIWRLNILLSTPFLVVLATP